MSQATTDTLCLFLSGDVMTGRGIDQVLPHPCAPVLHEPYVRDARDYVALAEEANGALSKPVAFSYIWGDALEVLRAQAPDIRLINLETSVTTSANYWQGKGIHYRMHPANIPCLSAAAIDCCVLANNHVLDWGYQGLSETLSTLQCAGIKTTGAGLNARLAGAPAVMEIAAKGRLMVFSYGLGSSGIPLAWAAGNNRPGVNLLADLSPASVRRIQQQVAAVKQAGDVVVASIHWGGNWGYEIPAEHIDFAHALIDSAGVDILHGHSSHHPLGVEIYQGKPVIYGCGDLLNDYEGIGGYQRYRGDLALLYFVRIAATGKARAELTMVPVQIRNFRLNYASPDDSRWLRDMLKRESRRFNVDIEWTQEGLLQLRA